MYGCGQYFTFTLPMSSVKDAGAIVLLMPDTKQKSPAKHWRYVDADVIVNTV